MAIAGNQGYTMATNIVNEAQGYAPFNQPRKGTEGYVDDEDYENNEENLVWTPTQSTTVPPTPSSKAVPASQPTSRNLLDNWADGGDANTFGDEGKGVKVVKQPASTNEKFAAPPLSQQQAIPVKASTEKAAVDKWADWGNGNNSNQQTMNPSEIIASTTTMNPNWGEWSEVPATPTGPAKTQSTSIPLPSSSISLPKQEEWQDF